MDKMDMCIEELYNLRLIIKQTELNYFKEMSKLEGINILNVTSLPNDDEFASKLDKLSPYYKWYKKYNDSQDILNLIDNLPLNKLKSIKNNLIAVYPFNVSKQLIARYISIKIQYLENTNTYKHTLVLKK